MKISRRKFIISTFATLTVGLTTIIGLKYKNVDKLSLFLSNYENIFPGEFSFDIKLKYNLSDEAILFERKVELMLDNIGLEQTIININKNIQEDYQSGNLKIFNKWIVSEIESYILELRRKNV